MTGLTTLLSNTWYEWSVRAISDSGIVGSWSEPARFITSPRAPTLRTPSQDAEDVATDRPRFEWQSVDSALRYIVSIRRANDGTVIILDSSASTTFTPDTLPMATRCVWTVRAVGRYGVGPHSPAWGFTTSSAFVLSAPVTIAPNNIDQVDTSMLSMTWSGVEGATSYDVQLTSGRSFANPDIELLGLANAFCDVQQIRPGTTYKWRVIGYSDTAVGRWSDTASFTSRPRFEQRLVPLTPERDATEVPLRGVLRFTTSPAYVEYEAQLAKDPYFSVLDHTFRTAVDTVEFYGLEPGTLYYWRVRGFLGGDQFDQGETSAFITTTSVSVSDGTDSGSDVLVTASDYGILLQLRRSGRYVINIRDLRGRLMRTQVMVNGSRSTILLSEEEYANGCYLVEIYRDSNTVGENQVICR